MLTGQLTKDHDEVDDIFMDENKPKDILKEESGSPGSNFSSDDQDKSN